MHCVMRSANARYRLLLSGTPNRTDDLQVPFVTYDDKRCFVADYSYDYREALIDGIVRPVEFLRQMEMSAGSITRLKPTLR